MTTSSPLAYGIPPDGYRLPDATRLGHVTLQVADLPRSLEYYTEVIGLRVLQQSSGVATLGAQSADAPLVELHERPGANAIPRRGRLGLYHFAILLPQRSQLGQFVQHLSAMNQSVGSADHLVSEALYLTDPDGLGIEVYADRPRSSWRHTDRQLAMASEPLDLIGLIGAAAGQDWNGIPAGTVIGHVHLFVSDLDLAESFFHAGLGLDKMVWNYPGALFLAAGGYHHHLGTNTWATHAEPATDADARLLEWEIIVPGGQDVETALQNLEKRGVPVHRDQKGGTARDPWGTPLRIRAQG